MTGVLLATRAGDESQATRAPIELRIEDSLKSIAMPIRSMSAIMVVVLFASLAVHAVLVVAAIVAERSPTTAPQQEIAVEIVQEPPKPAPPAKPPQQAKSESNPELKPKSDIQPKAEPKPEPAKPIPPAPQVAKVEPSKPTLAAPQPQAPKTQAPQIQAPKTQVVETQATKPAPPVEKAPLQAVKPAADPGETAALEKELADLRAQQAALKAERAPQPPAPQAVRGGPLAGSMQAIALPSSGEGDVVGYQEIVFSQLAKAKGDGEYHGQAGTTGVHFEVDADGRLLRAEVAASSGSATLDTQALDIVHRAAPFPPPPKDADHSFVANVNFIPSKP